MEEKKRFGITTTIIPLLQKDGRRRFEYPKPLNVRVLEWTMLALWLLAPAVVAAALM
ncbi:MAG: hypothetical protein ACT4P3_11335 [Betaproteobacteria bacterium]